MGEQQVGRIMEERLDVWEDAYIRMLLSPACPTFGEAYYCTVVRLIDAQRWRRG